MQGVTKTKKSFTGNKDIFNNTIPFNEDHIWPKSKGGTNAKVNLLKLSKKSNDAKKNLTSGTINGIRFSIEKKMTKQDEAGNQTTYGIMYVLVGKEWFKVVNG